MAVQDVLGNDITAEKRKRFFTLVAGVCALLLYVFILLLGKQDIRFLALLPVGLFLLFFWNNFRILLLSVVLLLFVPLFVSFFAASELFALVVFLSVVYQKGIRRENFTGPLTIFFFVLCLFILPSYFVAEKIEICILKFYHVISFLLLYYAITLGISSYDDIKQIGKVFLAATLANSLYVIVVGMETGKRVYGLPGVVFVDYVALAMNLLLVLFIVNEGRKRAYTIVAFIVVTLGLFFTQTRNAWLSAVITAVIITNVALLKPAFFGFPRTVALWRVIGTQIVIAALIVIAFSYSSTLKNRVMNVFDEKAASMDEWGNIQNSVITRVLIWETAFNAFKEHPITGIGFYAFPHSSHRYYDFPKFLYTKYVKGNSPHQTYIAIVTETGIIGFLGFCILAIQIVRIILETLKKAADKTSKLYALLGASSVLYMFISMAFTDMWLWGQGISLLAVILGIVSVNHKLVRSSSNSVT